MKHRGILCLVALAAFSVIFATERTNLGLSGGRVNIFTWDNINQLMYAGVESAYNLFVTADSGKSWELAYPYDSLEDGWSNDCDVVRTAGGVTVAIVGSGQKIIISEDGAQTWRHLFTMNGLSTLLSGLGFTGQTPSPSNVTMRYGAIYVTAGHLILKTTDMGTNWSVTVFPDSTYKNSAQDIRKNVTEVLPLDSLGIHLYATATEPDLRDPILYETTDGKIFSDTSLNATAGKSQVIGQMLFTAADPGVVVMLESQNVNGNSRYTQIWLSTDSAKTWDSLSTNQKLPGTNYDIAQMTLLEDPAYLHGFRMASGVNYSDDWGVTWKHVDNSNGPAIHGIRCHIPGTTTYVAYNEDAPYFARDSIAGPWAYSASGMSAVKVNRIAQHPTNLDLVYLATNSGIAITRAYTDSSITDPVSKWQSPNGVFPMQPMGGIPSVSTICINPYDSSIIHAGGGNGILKAIKGGFSKTDWTQDGWNTSIGGLDVTQFGQGGGGITSFAWYSPDTILASFSCVHSSYGGVMISIDGGDSFSVWQPLPQTCCNVVYVADDNALGRRMIFAGYGNRENNTSVPCMLWRSGDGGATWDSCTVTGGTSTQNTHNQIYDISCANGAVDTLFFACEFGVGLSTDSGNTVAIQTLPGVSSLWEICATAVDKTDKHSVYFASREKIYLYDWSKTGQVSFLTYFSSIGGETINDLLFDELTMGSSAGFFALTADTNTPVIHDNTMPKPLQTRLLFVGGSRTAGVKVSYATDRTTPVTVSLLNLSGRTMQTIGYKSREAGMHTDVLRASHLPRGTYLIVIQTKTAIIAKKFVMIR